MNKPVRKINDLRNLRWLLTQDKDGLNEHLYSKLRIGDMWWIPDVVSGFGAKDRHPWVVVVEYKPNRPPVVACPRTTQINNRSTSLYTPAGVLEGLDEEGVILLNFRRPFAVEKFREFEYIGRLSDEWIRKIQNGIKQQIGGGQ